MAAGAESVRAGSVGPLTALWHTTVGKKAVMAATGVVLVGFVVAHMVGNLKIYAGEAAFNAYAVGLRELGAPFFPHEGALWLLRLVLLAALVLHVVAAAQLWQLNRAARPVGYGSRSYLRADYAARTMRWGGVIVLLFVVYHLLHFTAGTVGYAPGQFRPLSVYRNVVAGFSVWYVSAFYIVAMAALGLHLYHGVWSLFQTLGVERTNHSGLLRGLAITLALAVVLGNASVPVLVLAGVVR